MRIVVASAHYPPNFVSGGTLQPQRLSRGMRGRGHDVSVFAGWLGDREPLETWTETDEQGLPVTWVVTTPWTGWSDSRNFDNPDVAEVFRSHLAAARPEVVHLHSLQSLGGGLLPVASSSGARVVVTMHDFWWVCGRQFLVDRSFRPCCLVVDAGTCECEVDRRWLAGRTAFLMRALRNADLVLAPSRSAARVLEANGVAASKLRVDENGFPASPAEAPATDATVGRDRGQGGEVLRVTYAGGPAEMKGIHVLLGATRLLAGNGGWSLAAYGAANYKGPERNQLEGLPVSLLPAFQPAELPAILAATDVMVVPSVMRETYSLVTREALTAGVPVVCTDSLGPEEVVEHGRNGLVVPSADPAALAGALSRLVAEPSLLAGLRAGCRSTPVRPIADQVDSLLARYGELSARPPTPARHRAASPGRVLFACGIEGAPLRYRARLPAEALGLLGTASEVRHYRDPDLLGLACDADAVVLYRVPATVQVLELVASLRSLGIPVLFDVDDVIFDPDIAEEIPALSILPPQDSELWMEGVRRYRTTMEACDVFIGSTNALCRHAEAVTGMPSERFGNGVGINLARHADLALGRPRVAGPLRLGYLSGTTTHDRDWLHVEEAVIEVLRSHPGLELWLVGHLRTSPRLGELSGRVRRLPFQRWDALPYLLRDIDVNLAPLEPGSRFNEAKSAIKWLEAGLSGTPTVASPTEAFREVIRHGDNGFLASERAEWVASVSELVEDESLRSRSASRARRDALLDWSPHLQGERYAAILSRALDTGGQRPASNWAPVTKDEPPLAGQLEGYLFDPDPLGRSGGDGAAQGDAAASSRPPVTSLPGRAAEVWRQEGPEAAVGASLRYLRRGAAGAARRVRTALNRTRS